MFGTLKQLTVLKDYTMSCEMLKSLVKLVNLSREDSISVGNFY